MSSSTVDTILFATSTFLAALLVLEAGADRFITHTVALSTRLRVPQVLVALLTAGAEWEELFVIVFALAQHRRGLARGNVVGSCISNVLGAFSLGLLCKSGVTVFGGEERAWTVALLGVTTVVVGLAWAGVLGRWVGGGLVVGFVVYVGVACWGIYRGVLAAPDDSDSDSEDGDETDEDGVRHGATDQPNDSGARCHSSVGPDGHGADEAAELLPKAPRTRRSTMYHVIQLIMGFLALSLSGYILSHSSSTLAVAAGIDESIFGATLLSLATTLPEKFIALKSGSRGYSGVLVANTVGSNIFLLTLCLGIILLSDSGGQQIRVVELAWMWGSSLALTVVVVLGSRRWMAATLLIAYAVFLALEFSVFRR